MDVLDLASVPAFTFKCAKTGDVNASSVPSMALYKLMRSNTAETETQHPASDATQRLKSPTSYARSDWLASVALWLQAYLSF